MKDSSDLLSVFTSPLELAVLVYGHNPPSRIQVLILAIAVLFWHGRYMTDEETL